jgi:hypothetical protein
MLPITRQLRFEGLGFGVGSCFAFGFGFNSPLRSGGEQGAIATQGGVVLRSKQHTLRRVCTDSLAAHKSKTHFWQSLGFDSKGGYTNLVGMWTIPHAKPT